MFKKSNEKGFTIMEMLIVVAIIAVLVAIAIPTFNGALTKAKEAADIANIRAAYAEVQVALLTDIDAIPANLNNYINSSDLNYPTKYSYTSNTGIIQYNPAKLTGGNGTVAAGSPNGTLPPYVWTIKNPTIN